MFAGVSYSSFFVLNLVVTTEVFLDRYVGLGDRDFAGASRDYYLMRRLREATLA